MNQGVKQMIPRDILTPQGIVQGQTQSRYKAGVEGVPEGGKIQVTNGVIIGNGLEIIKHERRMKGVGINQKPGRAKRRKNSNRR